MKIIKKIIVAFLTIILVLLMTFNIYNFYCIKILKQDLASIHGYAILEVVSWSMEPTIHVGDLIIIDTKETNYKKNDIVTFKDVDGSFVTHRIKYINEDTMITRGDNNDSNDEEMLTSSLIGKYLFKINGAGRLLAAFRSPFVMIMIFVIGILACIFVSTDKDGNPILEEDEKEFREFQKYRDSKTDKKQPDIKTEKPKLNNESYTKNQNNRNSYKNSNRNRNNYNHQHRANNHNYKKNYDKNISNNNTYKKRERDR